LHFIANRLFSDTNVSHGIVATYAKVWWNFYILHAFSALMLFVGWQEGHLACKKTEWWWGAGMVICLERGADLHMSQLMPLPLTVFCFSKIRIGFNFLVPAYPGSPEKGPLNGCVCGGISSN